MRVFKKGNKFFFLFSTLIFLALISITFSMPKNAYAGCCFPWECASGNCDAPPGCGGFNGSKGSCTVACASTQCATGYHCSYSGSGGVTCAQDGGGGCFPPGTVVKTPNGGMPIQSIRIGNTVTSFNDQTNKIENSSVSNIYKVRRAFLFFHYRRRIPC